MENYEMQKRGQVTRLEAGVFYKAYKNGDIAAYPEMANMLYDMAKEYILYADRRYSQDGLTYDRIERLIRNLLNNDFEQAQVNVNELQTDMIERSGQKSRWFKYKK